MEALLSTHKPNIVSICEHWMKYFELNSFALSNYHLCSSFIDLHRMEELHCLWTELLSASQLNWRCRVRKGASSMPEDK
jgi:hypothetical protein